ncbi:MAG: serine/threonine-protein phosphatase [Lachnospiraceae bacterium]|nr:serine/threonine-protein phosphatase [Lachnospiraceae bacterium]
MNDARRVQYKERVKKLKKGIVNQMTWPLVVLFVVIAVLQELILVGCFLSRYVDSREESAYAVTSHTAEIFQYYKALGWLVPFWHEHYADMEYVYDEAGIVELIGQFRSRAGIANAREVTEDQISARPYADQLLFAEIVYARCSMELDGIKQGFGLSRCSAVIREENDVFFAVNGAVKGEKRISQGGELYELGIRAPYEEGTYPLFDELVETGKRSEKFDKLLSFGGDHNGLVHMYAPVYDPDGNMVMVAVSSIPWRDFLTDSVIIWVIVFWVTIILLILILVWVRYCLKKVVINPVSITQDVIGDYSTDRDAGKALERLDAIRPDNELESLAEDFSHMITRIDKFASEISSMTAERERTETELANAAQIQEAALPGVFPDRKEFELFALMDPAREVGGDFYDFFFLNEHQFLLFIGDVSGKGMPGALFMMTAKALLKTRCLQGGSFSEMLCDVNEQLIEVNKANLFVTIWMGVIDITTGEGFAANAGHTDPIVKKADGGYEILRYRHSPIVGVLPGSRYAEHAFKLSPGESLFVYTDGVAEAVNADKELYGEERMLAVLNRYPDTDMKTLLTAVREDISEFENGEAQYDDITMIGFRFYGK